ncbi:hypothetical protein FBZ89_10858 [Nitrospirillum amazonense]|uniref:Secreted protein n=1 Tax=Nitrospirillum amazonense TaxID=28077 RepID=A0A560FBL5_9PROT|nr:hypothetical protein [Nitrospirillum amazonense]TWB19002.1 hypothetical protein FBZ89_10858 [Nitrospirillum amazonense]
MILVSRRRALSPLLLGAAAPPAMDAHAQSLAGTGHDHPGVKRPQPV